jgi:hypothetical protein
MELHKDFRFRSVSQPRTPPGIPLRFASRAGGKVLRVDLPTTSPEDRPLASTTANGKKRGLCVAANGFLPVTSVVQRVVGVPRLGGGTHGKAKF